MSVKQFSSCFYLRNSSNKQSFIHQQIFIITAWPNKSHCCISNGLSCCIFLKTILIQIVNCFLGSKHVPVAHLLSLCHVFFFVFLSSMCSVRFEESTWNLTCLWQPHIFSRKQDGKVSRNTLQKMLCKTTSFFFHLKMKIILPI